MESYEGEGLSWKLLALSPHLVFNSGSKDPFLSPCPPLPPPPPPNPPRQEDFPPLTPKCTVGRPCCLWEEWISVG